ncbi:unnamed protein product [Owenia fusiformis]|uniref:2-phosphoxylose phosphatase 1 n=2 Tax=Owenia fusiformis TaxID=6347 RepID=A0A8S4N174_OWEFU|nr:unnamed protein product [Owenia fusiformis]
MLNKERLLGFLFVINIILIILYIMYLSHDQHANKSDQTLPYKAHSLGRSHYQSKTEQSVKNVAVSNTITNFEVIPSRSDLTNNSYFIKTGLNKAYFWLERKHDSQYEGVVPTDYKVVSVHVLIRHGDRTPMIPVNNLNISCNFDDIVNRSILLQRYLEYMKSYAVWKNNPFSAILSPFPNSAVCSLSQLTGQGAMQHLNNGDFLRNVYIKRWKLLEDDGLRQKSEVHVRSTVYSRTYQSAVAFLFGFIPNFKLEALPIKPQAGIYFCSTYHTGFNCACAAASQYHSMAEKARSTISKNDKLWLSVKRDLLKMVKNGQQWLNGLFDISTAHICHGIVPPCFTPGCMKEYINMTSRVIKVKDRLGHENIYNEAYQKFQRLAIHPLIFEIALRMFNQTRSLNVPKFVLYSGHDLTVTALSVALGVNNGEWPKYATRFVLELIQSKNGSKFYIRAIFNGKDITSKVLFCQGKLEEGLCPANEFFMFVLKEHIRKYFDDSSYFKACLKANI